MDDSPDDLTIKDILETYFRCEDLRKVLKSFNLPFGGRKPELFERVLSLINHRQYELEFTRKAKRKITQTFRERIAPEVDLVMAPITKSSSKTSETKRKSKTRETIKKTVKRRRYESDSSYEESEDSSSDISSKTTSPSSSKSDDNSISFSPIKKRKRVITSSTDESDNNKDKDSDRESDSSEKTDIDIEPNHVKKRTEKSKKQKNPTTYQSSSSETSSDDTSDSDFVINRSKKPVKKNFLNINLSSDSEDDCPISELINKNSNKSDNTIIKTNNEESDDDIIFLEEIPASVATNNRLLSLTNSLKINSYSHTFLKESESSDTESSQDIPNDGQNDESLGVFSDFNPSEPSLVIDNSLLTTFCDSNNEQSLEMNAIMPEVNAITPEVNANTPQINLKTLEICEKMPELTNRKAPETPTTSLSATIDSIQSSNVTPTQPPIKTETKRPIIEQLPPKTSPSQRFIIIKTPKMKAPKQTVQKMANKLADKLWDQIQEKLPENLFLQITDPMATIDTIKRRLNGNSVESSEVEAIDQVFKLSLICPITNKRVSTPSRSINCQHIDCFDIHSFMDLNTNKNLNDWRCPKCKQPARLKSNGNDIIIDGLVKHILSATDPTCEAVIFDSKAHWTPDVKKHDNFSNKRKQNELILLDNALEDIIIELDDDDDPNPVPEPNTNLINSEIEKGKSLVNNLSNLLNQNQSIGSTIAPQTIEIRLNQQNSAPQKQIFNFTRTNPQIDKIAKIADIARFLSTAEQEVPQQSSNTNTLNNRQQTQICNQSEPQHSRTETQRTSEQTSEQIQQRTHQIQTQQQNRVEHNQQNSLLINNLNANNSCAQSCSIPYKSNPQAVTFHRTPQQSTYSTNDSNDLTSNSTPSPTTSSDHIKFDFDSGGNIKCVICQICNENIPIGSASKAIEIHVNGEKHKRLKVNYNRNTNQFIPSHQRSAYASNYNYTQYNNNINPTFQPQYPTNYLQSQQPIQPQYSSYYSQQYYPPRAPYLPSVPRPAHQIQPLPSPAHITPQNSSHYNSSYRNIAHQNQTQYPF